MWLKVLEVLTCPVCRGEFSCEATETLPSGEVNEGGLACRHCDETYPITNGIPRFIATDNYAASFGYQWNLFRSQQIDSVNGTELSSDRFYSETQWSPAWLRDKWILDAGCGAGRFLDVVSKNECQVVGVDISNAVDAARSTLAGRPNVHLVQASIYDLPFGSVFDGCYCIGVIQHTPQPRKTIAAVARVVKAGGKVAVTIYERKSWTLLYPKYWLRPITKRIEKTRLLRIIKGLMPLLFPITNLLFRLPVLGPLFVFMIPVANYVNEPRLTRSQRYDWAILDTFDMLSPEYDQPQTEGEVTQMFAAEGLKKITRLSNPGVNLIGEKDFA